MAFFRSSKSARKPAASRRSAAPRLEVLEDRLAPAGGLLGVLDFPSQSLVAAGHPLAATVAAMPGLHPLGGAISSRFAEASREGFPRLTAFRAHPRSHPFLAALREVRLDGGARGDNLPPFSFGGLSPLGVSPEQGIAATMILAPANVNPLPAPLPHPAAVATRSNLVGPPNPLPSPLEGMGFSPFLPSILLAPGKDRPMAFELSPFAPSGLDIVPVPVPAGLADRLTDLLGDPPRDPLPDHLLGEGRDTDAVRAAVARMLREGWAPPGPLDMATPRAAKKEATLLPLPPSGVSSLPSAEAAEIVAVTLPPLLEESDSQAADEPPVVGRATRAMLAAAMAGLGFIGWRGWRRDRRENGKE